MPDRPLVLGHRGASAAAPENTVAAFAKARELGADGVELDVRRSADGVLTVHHDPDVPGAGPIARMSFSDLRAARPDVATLDEALAACAGLLVNAEVKCLPWEPDADRDGSVMRATLDAIVAFAATGPGGSFVISSFDIAAVDLALDYAPDLATGWLTHGQAVADAAPIAAGHGHRWLNPDVTSALAAGADGIAAAHAAGLQVSVWTVDKPDDARALAAMGVESIISNVPDVVIGALAPRGDRL
jgi:glycerophosphoryl diester phosphodiesterase